MLGPASRSKGPLGPPVPLSPTGKPCSRAPGEAPQMQTVQHSQGHLHADHAELLGPHSYTHRHSHAWAAGSQDESSAGAEGPATPGAGSEPRAHQL